MSSVIQSARARTSARLFTKALHGVLVTDFWAAYNALRAWVEDRQCCLTHLLRELEKVDHH